MFWAVCPSVCVHAIYMHTLASLEALTDQLAIVFSCFWCHCFETLCICSA